jgi:hypothetical protein
MRIYTAANFALYERVRAFNQALRDAGHEITHDWSIGPEFDESGHPRIKVEKEIPLDEQRRHAILDREGVLSADVVIFLADEGSPFGAVLEVGMAMGANYLIDRYQDRRVDPIKVWVLAPRRWSIFYTLPGVQVFDDENQIRAELGAEPLGNYRGPGVYRHFRGHEYEVIGLSVREETVLKHGEKPLECSMCGREYSLGEEPSEACGSADRGVYGCKVVRKDKTVGGVVTVIYRSINHNPRSKVDFWERTLDSFNEKVYRDGPENVCGMVPRFKFVGSLKQILADDLPRPTSPSPMTSQS